MNREIFEAWSTRLILISRTKFLCKGEYVTPRIFDDLNNYVINYYSGNKYAIYLFVVGLIKLKCEKLICY